MRTTYYMAAALAALNLANAISITSNSQNELQQFSSELAQIDSELTVFSDAELDSYTDNPNLFVPANVGEINDMLQGGHANPTNGLVLRAVNKALREFGSGEPTANDNPVKNWVIFAEGFNNVYKGYKAE